MNRSRCHDARPRGAGRYLRFLFVAAAFATVYAAGVGAEPDADIGEVPPSLAPVAAEAQAAVVTLKLPGRAFVHGLFVDDWPDEEVRLEQLLLDGLDSGDVTIGSAVMIEGSGIAVTTAQLGRRALLLKAVTADGRRVSAMVVGRDEETNVAVLTLCCDQRPFHAIALGNSDAVKVGDRVVAVGAPFGLEHSATASVVSGRTTDDADALAVLLHTGPTVTSGYAGGPVVDTTPTMVGLVVRNEAGMGMVLPSNTVRRIVSAILEDGRVRRGSLGVKGQTLDADLAETFGASAIRGVIVVDVRHGGPAARAGFRTGDIISAIDGRQVESSARLARAVAALAPGRTVSVALWRDGRALTAPVRVDEEPDDEAIGSLGWRSHALLGADVAAITSDIGVVVAGVEPGGPAERAGIRRLDVIREMNGLMIRSLDDFDDALKTLTVESRVPVLLQRGATSLYVTLRP